MPYVAVVGAARGSRAELAAAEAVGARLAEQGAVIVCGGLGGVMEAACRGARSAGGTTVGILPGAERSDANPWIDIALATGLGEARNALVVRAADALVAVGGAYGTLSEIAFALKAGKPVIGLETWRFEAPAADADPVVRCDDPAQAVAAVMEALRRDR